MPASRHSRPRRPETKREGYDHATLVVPCVDATSLRFYDIAARLGLVPHQSRCSTVEIRSKATPIVSAGGFVINEQLLCPWAQHTQTQYGIQPIQQAFQLEEPSLRMFSR